MSNSVRVAQDVGLKVRDSSNILILAPSPHPMDINLCTDLLAVRPPEEVNVWCLGITLSPEERIRHWYDRVGPLPTEFKIVTTGSPPSPTTLDATDPFDEGGDADEVAGDEATGDDAASGSCDHAHSDAGACSHDAPEITTLREPGNLTKIGVEFAEALNEWRDAPERTMICIHSVTALVQYAEFTQAFKFLHELTNEVEQTNAVAHYHMDPSAHEDKTVGKIKRLFDTVVRVDSDDSWHVMTREFEAHGDGAIPTLDAIDTPPAIPE